MTGTNSSDGLFVRLPLAMLDLVADGKVSKNAAWLYVLLLSHVNWKRGDAKVWPSRRSLAERMNMAQPRAVDRYVEELKDAGVLSVDRRKVAGAGNDTNLYTLLLLPPPPSAQERTTPSAPQSTTPSAQERTNLVSGSAHELDEPQLDEVQQDETPAEREMPAKQASQRQTADEAGFEILTTRYGYNTAEAQHLISVLHRRYGIFSAEWWYTAYRNGSLSERITEVIEEYKLDVAARSAQSAA